MMFTIAFMLLTLPGTACQISKNIPNCVLRDQSPSGYLQGGELTLGVFLEVFMSVVPHKETFSAPPLPNSCYSLSLRYYRHFLAAVYAVEEINRNPNILPNVTLGFHIYDSCSSEKRALANILSILTGRAASIPNYTCEQEGILVAFIGHLLSSLSYVAAEITGLVKYPQISYGAQDSMLSDGHQFPGLYRTATNQKVQNEAIIQLLKLYNWKWVGIVGSLDETHQRATEELRDGITKSGVCVAFLVYVSMKKMHTFSIALDVINKSTATVIIINSSQISFIHIIYAEYNPGVKLKHIWIASYALDITADDYGLFFHLFNGSFFFLTHQGEIPGLKDFLYSASPSKFPDDDITEIIWRIVFGCVTERNKNEYNRQFRLCTVNDTMKVYEKSLFPANSFRLTYSMYIAVYAVAHALHDTLFGKEKETFHNASRSILTFSKWKLNHYLKKVHFKTTSGDEFFFDEHGEVPGHLDIVNWNVFPNETVTSRKVGTFSSSDLHEKQLVINSKAILWGHFYDELTLPNHTPISICTASCMPGYRKAIQKGQPICCYDCVQCSEGEISNDTDLENCIQCPEDQWSNEQRDRCIKKTIEFLSFTEPLGLVLTLLAIIFTIKTAFILGIFLKYKETLIVKANNRELTYSLLISLMVSFICSLLFIGRPMKITCLLRQVAFGINFAISISSILGKTMTVIIAFKAIKPGSKLKNYVGSKFPRCIVVFCLLGEVLICNIWLICYPPYPDNDTKSQPSKIILQCYEGSVIAFYLSVGYVAILAFVSFFVAFLARKLPATFNEARYITFSMVVFCSVWIAFIPTYLSTKGKNMITVEIFAILSSNYGLLTCIFFPKCYIIIFQPDRNTKKYYSAPKS